MVFCGKPVFEDVKHKADRAIIIGGGESLRGYDFRETTDFPGAVITVNNCIFHLPRADYWMTVDPMWQNEPQPALKHKRYTTYYYCAFPDLENDKWSVPFYTTTRRTHYLERIVPDDEDSYQLQEDKKKITTGDSIYGAIGLAYHMGVKKILLLGVDVYGYGHWYDRNSPYNAYKQKDDKFDEYKAKVIKIYRQCVPQLKARGIDILNGSEYSKIDAFKKDNLKNGLKWIRE